VVLTVDAGRPTLLQSPEKARGAKFIDQIQDGECRREPGRLEVLLTETLSGGAPRWSIILRVPAHRCELPPRDPAEEGRKWCICEKQVHHGWCHPLSAIGPSGAHLLGVGLAVMS